jgi:hypothetical protein
VTTPFERTMTFSRDSLVFEIVRASVGVRLLRCASPSSRRAAFGLQEHGALRLEDVERVRPELQPRMSPS